MPRSIKPTVFIASLATVLVLTWTFSGKTEKLESSQGIPSSVAKMKQETSVASETQKKPATNNLPENTVTEDLSRRRLSDYTTEQLLANVDLMNGTLLRAIVLKVSQTDPMEISQAITSLYRKAGSQSPILREKALWFAKTFQSTELVPLWEDVLLRKTLRSAKETEAWDSSQPPPYDIAMRTTEQLDAVRALGELRENSSAADGLLQRIIRNEQEVPGDSALIREQAALVFVREDRSRLMPLVQNLSSDDELRKRLLGLAHAMSAEAQ